MVETLLLEGIEFLLTCLFQQEVIACVSGIQVYRKLRFESGVHRVQRIPSTEQAGRVHTSTMTVAVMPEPEEVWELSFHLHLFSSFSI